MTFRGIIENTQVVNPSGDNTADPQMIIVSIYDMLDADESGDPEVYQLTLGERPIVTEVVDNDEDKYTPIRATQVTIVAHTDSQFNINTFDYGGDNRWRVEIDINELGRTVFMGWLSIADINQTFQGHPNELVLTAYDGLGRLKDIAMVDFDGENPMNENRLIDYIVWCLRLTGLSLEVYAIANIRHYQVNDHLFNAVYVDAKTFEAEVGVSEDAYTTLQKILGEFGYLKQYKGRWYIMCPDEFDNNDIRQYVFAADGTAIGELAPTTLIKRVGEGNTLSWMDDDNTEVSFDLACGFVKETYNYSLPQEVPCNNDFSRGELIEDVGPDEKHFNLDCWSKHRANYPTSDLISATTDIYIRRDYLNDREDERYVVIEAVGATPTNLILSDQIFLKKQDKFALTIGRRLSADIGGASNYTDQGAQVRLYGDDGTFWTLHGGTITDQDPRWEQCLSDFTNNQQLISFQGNTSRDMTETETKDVTAPPLPAGGFIRILLYQSGVWGTTVDTYIDPPQLELILFVGGTYRKYTGQYNKVSQPEQRNSRDNEVYISDSPHPAYKGAMKLRQTGNLLYTGSIQFGGTGFALAGDVTGTYYPGMYLLINTASVTGYFRVLTVTYNVVGNTTAVTISPGVITGTESGTINIASFVLGSLYYAYNVFPAGPPDITYCHPFGYIQAFAVWNQHNRTMRKFEGNIDGLETGLLDGDSLPDIPDCLHRYELTDADISTNNKYFMLLHREQDLNLSSIEGAFLAEVYDTTIPKVYDDTHEFKFLTGNE